MSENIETINLRTYGDKELLNRLRQILNLSISSSRAGDPIATLSVKAPTASDRGTGN